MIAFRITGLTRRSATGWRTPLAPSSPSRVPSRDTRMLARAAPCASRPSRLHEYQKNGPATAAPTAKPPMSTTTHAAAICSPSFKRPVRALPSPIATPGKRRRQLVLRRQHGTRHCSPLALGADRGVHLVALRLVVHRTQGTPQRTRLLSYARDAMCFDVDSEPPIPRISGAAVSHDDLVLESEDGNKFAAFRALPDGDLSTGVVILPDVRGLYRFYEELALRFAERGHAAVAFDSFGR